MKRVLIVEDKESLASMLRETLESEGMKADVFHSAEAALRHLQQGRHYDAVLTDLRLPGASGNDLLARVKEIDPDCPVIVMTGYGTIGDAVEAMRRGAWDFIEKPVDIDRLLILLSRCFEQRRLGRENLLLRDENEKRHQLPAIIGGSTAMRTLSEQVRRVAVTDSTVLLQGESGTGKELFARALHQLSPRRERPFVAVNCAAIPETLLENELFGHERGAFTGASSRQLGKFELADGGTIFLDEIGELGFAVQSKLLRVLQERQITRIGGAGEINVDVRVICATNRDLAALMKEGRFREDLYYRIAVVPLTIPPLRARRDDIGPLADHFIDKLGRELNRAGVKLSPEAREHLERHDWPGNIRELENCIERAIILADAAAIGPSELAIGTARGTGDALRESIDLRGDLPSIVKRTVETVEKLAIEDALACSAGSAEAAERLGISLRTLQAKMREYEIRDRRS